MLHDIFCCVQKRNDYVSSDTCYRSDTLGFDLDNVKIFF